MFEKRMCTMMAISKRVNDVYSIVRLLALAGLKIAALYVENWNFQVLHCTRRSECKYNEGTCSGNALPAVSELFRALLFCMSTNLFMQI